MTRKFHVTSDLLVQGVIFSFDKKSGLFVSVEIKDNLTLSQTDFILQRLKAHVDLFLAWAKTVNTITVVEIDQAVTFEMFWLHYDDKIRSSKKRSEKLWTKLPAHEQVKAYYYIPTYNRNRGTAEKKYCETYLNAELWNN